MGTLVIGNTGMTPNNCSPWSRSTLASALSCLSDGPRFEMPFDGPWFEIPSDGPRFIIHFETKLSVVITWLRAQPSLTKWISENSGSRCDTNTL